MLLSFLFIWVSFRVCPLSSWLGLWESSGLLSCGALLDVGVSGSHTSVRNVLEVVWSPWCLEPTSVDVSLAH